MKYIKLFESVDDDLNEVKDLFQGLVDDYYLTKGNLKDEDFSPDGLYNLIDVIDDMHVYSIYETNKVPKQYIDKYNLINMIVVRIFIGFDKGHMIDILKNYVIKNPKDLCIMLNHLRKCWRILDIKHQLMI